VCACVCMRVRVCVCQFVRERETEREERVRERERESACVCARLRVFACKYMFVSLCVSARWRPCVRVCGGGSLCMSLVDDTQLYASYQGCSTNLLKHVESRING